MNLSPHLHNHLSVWRIASFLAVVGLVFLVFIIRLFSLQIIEAETWVSQAVENRVKEFNIQAPRGIIYDRNGVVLARNVASYNVVITAAHLPDDPGSVEEIFRQLSTYINVPVNRSELSVENPYVPCISDHGIKQIVEYGSSSTPYTPVKVKCDVNRTTAMIIQEKSVDWPGVSVEIESIRDYPTGSLTASLIGFLGPIPANREEEFREKGLVPNRDKVGYAGLELQYQDILAGKNGLRTSEVDVGGRVVRQDVEPPIDPIPGSSIRLTIDIRLQQATEAIFKKELDEWNVWYKNHGLTEAYSTGVVIAINPKTGEVLSIISYPSYENNRMARFIPSYYYDQLIEDPSNPLLNHAVGDVLPAGSVFKLVTAVGALNEGIVEPDQVIETPGKISIIDKPFANAPGTPRDFVDWIYQNGLRPEGFGKLDFLHGLANSSNVYFYKLGGGYQDEVPEGLEICRLGTYAAALGYGQAVGIGLPDEQKGLIPDPKWKRVTHAESWTIGDTYIASVGQGFVLSTPLQVLMSTATIANDGKLMQPTIIREFQDGEGNILPVYLDEEGNATQDPKNAARQLSPFQPKENWDITQDRVIQEFGEMTIQGCEPIEGELKTVQPWVIEKVKEGMRLAVTEGTLDREEVGFDKLGIPAAGKTGTAEYCDKFADEKNLCIPGSWPSHAWTVGFAPYEDPEIAVVAFVYNGGEGSIVAGPIVRQVIQAYFELKAIDNQTLSP